MNISRTLWALFVFLSCFTYGIAAEPEENKRYVEVSGEGEAKAVPDQVRLNFGIESFGKTVKEAQQENARQTQALLDALREREIEKKDIQSDSVQIHPRYDYPGGKSRLIDYRAGKNFSVLIRDLSNYGLVMESVVSAGVQRVTGVQFQTSQKEVLRDQARKSAVDDAKTKAEALAVALGQKVGRPLSVVESGFSPPMPMGRAMMALSPDAAGEPVQDQLAPGEIVIRGNVQIKFELME